MKSRNVGGCASKGRIIRICQVDRRRPITCSENEDFKLIIPSVSPFVVKDEDTLYSILHVIC